jgi:hypothetical protein
MSLRRAVALGLLLVVERSARDTLAAGASEARVPGASDAQPIAPPVASTPEAVAEPIAVTLRPARGTLLSGIDRELAVTIDVSGPGAERFVPARTFATVGTLEMPVAAGPGHFTTRYLPPAERFPQVALLVVELSNGTVREHAAARVALQGSTVVPFHTSGGAAVTMRVGDRLFGPVVADHQGHVEIAIEVPPGVRKGQARAVDRSGAARDTEVDLKLPIFPRIVLLAPAAFEAGAFAEVTAIAVNEDGSLTPAGAVTLAASAGTAHALGASPTGGARFLFEAPRRIGSGAVALTGVAAGDPPSRVDLAVPLRAARPAQLQVAPDGPRLVVGEPAPVRVVISAQDEFGNPAPAAGVRAIVDGHPSPVAMASDGSAWLSILPPSIYPGRDTVTVDAGLGDLGSSAELHVTGSAPARLTLEVGPRRLIADGRRGTRLRVQAVDKNGTPTMVRGLSWETPEGRVRQVRVPRDGEYLAEYVPDRTHDPHRELVAVMASPTLRAEGNVDVLAAPVRLVAGVRVGLFTNLGHGAGPAAFVEALAPLPVPRLRVFAGFAAGYLRADITSPGVETAGSARLETSTFPLLAMARAALPLPRLFELGGDLDAGWAWAWTRMTATPSGSGPSGTTPTIVLATADTVALGAGLEVAYPLRPGRLAVGLRYLWIDLGRTSQGDRIAGNSAGLIGDIGYKLTF